MMEMTESGVIDKVALVYGQMNEPPGARLRVGLSGPHDGRVLPRRGPGRPALHRQHLPLRPGGLRGLGAPRPDAERRRLPADARDRDGPAPGADHVDDDRLGHLGAGDLRARRRPHRPGAREHVRAPRLDDDALARDRREGDLPGDGSARLDLAGAPARDRLRTTTTASRRRFSRSCSATRTCRTSSRSSGWTSSPTRTSSSSPALAKSSGSSRSRTSSPSSSPAPPGKYVKLEDTIAGFDAIIQGEHDELPEAAFYMVGPIEDVQREGGQLEKAAA